MRVAGTVRVPGDKSITHRALLLGALALGTGFFGGGTLSKYRDENGSRFFVVAFDDGSWFAFGIQ